MPAYPNGVYTPGQYPLNVLHPSNPFYCSEQMPPRQPQYHGQDRTTAGSPQPPYPVPHCQGVRTPSRYVPYIRPVCLIYLSVSSFTPLSGSWVSTRLVPALQ